MASSSPLEFFKAELAAETTVEKAKVLRRTKIIAGAIGPLETREKLLPVLIELADSDEDEVLFGVAEELGTLLDFIGPVDQFAGLLVPPLEGLLCQEETIVRDRAIATVVLILERLHEARCVERFIDQYLTGMIDRLAKGDWFPSKVSACGLLAPLYKYVKEDNRIFLRKLFAALAADDTPMVRRAAASRMKDLVAVAELTIIDKIMFPLVTAAWKIEANDAVRVSSLLAFVEMAKKYGPEENQSKILPVIQTAATDRSWKVRLALTEVYDQLIERFGSHAGLLLPPFKTLLQDTEQDIRVAALTTAGKFLGKLNQKDVMGSGLDAAFRTLAEDLSPVVRAAVASVIGQLAVAYGRETAEETLVPVMLEMMKDVFHDVRLNIVCHAGELCELLGLQTVGHSLVAAIESLIQDSQWRIRLEVVNQIPTLAKQFGPTAFQSNLEPLFLSAFADPVFAVREAAIENIKSLGETFGSQWAAKDLLPRLLARYHGRQQVGAAGSPVGKLPGFSTTSESECPVSYAARVTVLRCIPVLVKILPASAIENEIIALLLEALKDPVSNVRLAAVRIIHKLSNEKLIRESLLVRTLQPALAKLAEDDHDVDVQFFTQQALQAVR